MLQFCNSLLLVYAFALLVGCSSHQKVIGFDEKPYTGNAHPWSYVSDAMTVHQPMVSRPDWKPWQFYYKTCENSGSGSFYSKTSYACTDPYY